MMLPRRILAGEAPKLRGRAKSSVGRGRNARLGESMIVLSGDRPRVGESLVGEFLVPPARLTREPLRVKGLAEGVVIVSTLPNIRAHACHAQILALEEKLPHYLPTARLCHVSSDGLDAWCEVDAFHPDLRACGYTLDGADASVQAEFRAAFGIGVENHERIAHGLFLIIDGVFRLVHIPRQQLGTPNVSAFLRRAARIVDVDVSALDKVHREALSSFQRS
jgi:hypothetical protein